MAVVDFDLATDADGRILIELPEADGTKTAANSAADGTLRFLALLVALSDDQRGRTRMLEEIDNGLHQVRLDLPMQLIDQYTHRVPTFTCAWTATTSAQLGIDPFAPRS